MLRLKRVSLIGFKTFCDHTEFTVPGSGIAVVAGPNGCGKSNILDGMSWVLGEQSAKSLRGVQMQDVIFAGTRDRVPLNMAEVTLTLVDPEIYEEPLLAELNQSTDLGNSWDWDEDEMRRQRAAEAEAIAAAAGPQHEAQGDVVQEEPSPKHSYSRIRKDPRSVPQFTVRQGETVITRRLFRTGESEYLLNGKQCRLRDLQEIFLSAGLGPDTYAIIGQEQIGQLLSSKPYDRRAVIEEAAGVGELKMDRRLVEARLNGANDSLARVDDILEEVSRQVMVLKRQAAKAERVGVVRDDLHRHGKILMANRVALVDTELGQLESGIVDLTGQIEVASARIQATEGEQHTLAQQGYELERAVQEAQNAANAAEVELERATAEQGENDERLRELEQRLLDAVGELEKNRAELSEVVQDREQQEALAFSANEEFRASENAVAARQQDAHGARQAVFATEQQMEAQRRHAAQLMTRAGEMRNGAIHRTDITFRSEIRQLSAGSGFALVRFATECGSAYWVKATGEPNKHEFQITATLSELFPEYLPTLVAMRSDWNAWVCQEDGHVICDNLTLALIETATLSLAELQKKSIAYRYMLIGAGCPDRSLLTLKLHLGEIFNYLAEAMDRQVSLKSPRLSRSRLRELENILRYAIDRMQSLGIPDTLTHNDLNPGNLLTDGARCMFIDWAEAGLGNPFLTFQNLCVHLARSETAPTSWIARMRHLYRRSWKEILTETELDVAFALMPILAIANCLYGRGDWLISPRRDNEQVQAYKRSLARHIDSAARSLLLEETPCR